MVKVASDELELKRIQAPYVLFGNLGKLMDKFNDNPSLIEKFFNLKLLHTYISPCEERITATKAICSRLFSSDYISACWQIAMMQALPRRIKDFNPPENYYTLSFAVKVYLYF